MKYGYPLLVMIIGGWLVKIENMFIQGSAHHLLVTLTLAIAMFAFGICLQPKHKNNTWFKKLVVSFVFLLLVLVDLGYVVIPIVGEILNYLAVSGVIYYLFYIYLGWLFFD